MQEGINEIGKCPEHHKKFRYACTSPEHPEPKDYLCEFCICEHIRKHKGGEYEHLKTLVLKNMEGFTQFRENLGRSLLK